MNPTTDPGGRYRRSGDEASQETARTATRAQLVSHLRTGAFVLTVLPLLLLETTDRAAWWVLLTAAAGGAVAFGILVHRHRRLRRQLHRSQLRERLAAEGLARLERDWDGVPRPPAGTSTEEHPCAADLDLTGHASLEHLVGRATTAPGRTLLRRWILDPLAPPPAAADELLGRPASRAGGVEGGRRGTAEGRDPGGKHDPLPPDAEPVGTPWPGWADELAERQGAVRALASEPDFREAVELAGREVGGREHPGRVRMFLRWAREDRWLARRPGLHLAGAALSVFTPAALLGWWYGFVHGALPVLGVLLALGLHRRLGGEAGRRLDAAEAGEGALERWTALLALVEEMPVPEGAPLLAELRETVRSPEPGASEALRRLRRIVDTAGVRRSSLAHFPLVILFAWDVHMLAWLERWQARNGEAVERWILALARAEALASLGALVHDHPEWAFPDFSADPEAGIRARKLAHPLLPPDEAVANDVALPAPGRLLLVTGSNMAGKTTLLRALGTNQILALMGAPVAAQGLRTRPILPWTAMRVRDSLAEGVSYFLAELRRLRRLVDAARASPVLYLLDEILLGTNTAERRTAARIVLDHLLRTGSVGAVTTHDLTLADHPALGPRLEQVHFREQVREVDGQKTLDFDYLLRPGPATSRNALLLLEIVGLRPPAPPPEEDPSVPGEP